MLIQASVNTLDIESLYINVEFRVKDKNQVTAAADAIKAAGGEVTHTTDNTIGFEANLDYTSGTIRSNAIQYIKAALGDDIKFSRSGIKISGYFIFNVTFDYKQTNGNDILGVLAKAGKKNGLYYLNKSMGDNSLAIAVTDALTGDEAKYRLGVVLTNTPVYKSGVIRRIDWGTGLQEYVGKKLNGYGGKVRAGDPLSKINYATKAKKEYLDKMQDYMQSGFYSFRDLVDRLSGDGDTSETDIARAEKTLDSALNSVSIATWAEFRAKRLDKLVSSALEKSAPLVEEDPDQYEHIKEAASEFDKIPTVPDTINTTLQELEKYQEVYPLMKNIAALISEQDVDKTELVSETGAKRLGTGIKNLVVAELDKYKERDASGNAQPTKERNKFINDLISNVHETDLVDHHTQEQLDSVLEGTLGDAAQFTRENELFFGDNIAAGKYPVFFLDFETQLEEASNKDEKKKIYEDYKAKLIYLKKILEENTNNDGVILEPNQKKVTKLMKEAFSGIDPSIAIENIDTWISEADAKISQLDKGDPKSNKPDTLPKTDVFPSVSPKYPPQIEQFLKLDSLTEREASYYTNYVQQYLLMLTDRMDEIEPDARTVSALMKGKKGKKLYEEVLTLVKAYDTVKGKFEQLIGSKEATAFDIYKSKIERFKNEAQEFANKDSSDYRVYVQYRANILRGQIYRNEDDKLSPAEQQELLDLLSDVYEDLTSVIDSDDVPQSNVDEITPERPSDTEVKEAIQQGKQDSIDPYETTTRPEN